MPDAPVTSEHPGADGVRPASPQKAIKDEPQSEEEEEPPAEPASTATTSQSQADPDPEVAEPSFSWDGNMLATDPQYGPLSSAPRLPQNGKLLWQSWV